MVVGVVPSITPTGLLLDEIAACERRVRGLQARQLALLAEYAEAVRDGLRPGECELTERMTPPSTNSASEADFWRDTTPASGTYPGQVHTLGGRQRTHWGMVACAPGS